MMACSCPGILVSMCHFCKEAEENDWRTELATLRAENERQAETIGRLRRTLQWFVQSGTHDEDCEHPGEPCECFIAMAVDALEVSTDSVSTGPTKEEALTWAEKGNPAPDVLAWGGDKTSGSQAGVSSAIDRGRSEGSVESGVSSDDGLGPPPDYSKDDETPDPEPFI